jgi:hypothetical protein
VDVDVDVLRRDLQRHVHERVRPFRQVRGVHLGANVIIFNWLRQTIGGFGSLRLHPFMQKKIIIP